jgi:DNA-binding CsgD family transcriptional regulator
VKRRGRPPHPDVLTPREWDVLTLVRDGLTNPQIAERLGISFDAAKYHVAEILSKLGLSTREEAAAWRPEPPVRPVLRPAWARALGPIAGLWRAWPIAVRIAGATVMAATVAGLGLLLYGVLRSGDNDSEIANGTPAVTVSAGQTPRTVIVRPGQSISVLTYDAPANPSGSCDEIFRWLVPSTGQESQQVATCTAGPSAGHLVFEDTGSGVLRLQSVGIVLLAVDAGLPTKQTECSDVIPRLVDASALPVAATVSIYCTITFPATATGVTVPAWMQIPTDAATPSGAVPCWQVTITYHEVDEVPTNPIQCQLAVPATATPGPVPTIPAQLPAILQGASVQALTIGEDAEFPGDISLLTLLGCTQCDGPAWGIGRTYRDADGTARIEPLLWTNALALGIDGPKNSLGLPLEGDYAVTGAAADPLGREIVVSVPVDNTTILYRSIDGGVTWQQYVTLDSTYSVYAMTAPGEVLVGTYAFGPTVPFQIVPAVGEITPPDVDILNAGTANGQLVWVSSSGQKLASDSGVLLSDAGSTLYLPVFGGDKTTVGAMTVHQEGHGYYVAKLDTDYHVQGAYFSPEAYVGPGVWLNDRQLLAMAPAPSDRTIGRAYAEPFADGGIGQPIIIDMDTGVVHAIPDPYSGQFHLAGREILALQTGPFDKVTGTGSCLNVRSAPAEDAPMLRCVADGVLLFDVRRGSKIAAATPIDGWLEVVTITGEHGYASSQYLQQLP